MIFIEELKQLVTSNQLNEPFTVIDVKAVTNILRYKCQH